MKLRFTAPLLSLLLCLASVTSAAQEKKSAIKPINEIAWLVGDWHATATPPTGEPTQIDNHVYWDETHTAIFFLTKFNGQPHYSGMYAYDPGTGQISFWYVDVDGNFTSGTARTRGKRLFQEFSTSKADGSKGQLQSYIDAADGYGSYHWQVLREGNTTPLIELDYTRVK